MAFRYRHDGALELHCNTHIQRNAPGIDRTAASDCFPAVQPDQIRSRRSDYHAYLQAAFTCAAKNAGDPEAG